MSDARWLSPRRYSFTNSHARRAIGGLGAALCHVLYRAAGTVGGAAAMIRRTWIIV